MSKIVNMDDEYTCYMCGGKFQASCSHEEAAGELGQLFPGVPVEDCEVVCDDCFKKLPISEGEEVTKKQVDPPMFYESGGPGDFDTNRFRIQLGNGHVLAGESETVLFVYIATTREAENIVGVRPIIAGRVPVVLHMLRSLACFVTHEYGLAAITALAEGIDKGLRLRAGEGRGEV